MTDDAYRTLCQQAELRGYHVLLRLDPHGNGIPGELTHLEVRDKDDDLLARIRLIKDDNLQRAALAAIHDLHTTGHLTS